jgi:hypothetical protein
MLAVFFVVLDNVINCGIRCAAAEQNNCKGYLCIAVSHLKAGRPEQ